MSKASDKAAARAVARAAEQMAVLAMLAESGKQMREFLLEVTKVSTAHEVELVKALGAEGYLKLQEMKIAERQRTLESLEAGMTKLFEQALPLVQERVKVVNKLECAREKREGREAKDRAVHEKAGLKQRQAYAAASEEKRQLYAEARAALRDGKDVEIKSGRYGGDESIVINAVPEA